jgi:VanZ family protein
MKVVHAAHKAVGRDRYARRKATVVEVKKRWLIFGIVITATVGASFVPVSTAPEPAQKMHAASDLLWHAATYAVVATAGFYAADQDRWVFVAVGVFAVGACVEVAQGFIAYRTASLFDAAANAVGVSVSLAAASLTKKASRFDAP